VTTGSGPNPSYTFDANNHITSSGIVYDAAGNITNDGLGHTYTYDAENRLLTVAGSSSATYLYDALGQRVQATINSSPADFIYDQFGRAVTQATASVWQRSELYAGWHVATYTNNTTYFDHSDWLGTQQRVRSFGRDLHQPTIRGRANLHRNGLESVALHRSGLGFRK